MLNSIYYSNDLDFVNKIFLSAFSLNVIQLTSLTSFCCKQIDVKKSSLNPRCYEYYYSFIVLFFFCFSVSLEGLGTVNVKKLNRGTVNQ